MAKKLHRFIGPYQLGEGIMRLDDAALEHQMRSVLKLAPGEVVIIGDGEGREAHCRIVNYQRGAVMVEGVSIGRSLGEPQLRTTLYLSILKADHFELAAAHAAEVGVTRIVPLLTARTVKSGIRHERLQRIVREAAELAGRGAVPEVKEPLTLERAWHDAAANDVNFFFDPSGKPFNGVAKSVRAAGLFIGPEGGWDDRELEEVARIGLRIVTLGPLVFRAQTAAMIATYLVVRGEKM